MRTLVPACLVLSVSFALGCKGSEKQKETPPPAGSPAREVALAGSVVMIGVGDIARCESNGDEITAALVDSVIKVDSAANVPTLVFTIGDNVYSNGTTRQFAECFGTSWGDPKRRIMGRIRPTPGNHDYNTPGAKPYYAYFGDRAGPADKGYYSYDFGEWHIVALNSELAYRMPDAAREQEKWLEDDLARHRKLCTMAYFHRPLFSSGDHGNALSMRRLWDILYAGNVDLVLGGHDHHYERFLPQTPAGRADSVRGIQEIVVGTGGGDLRGVSEPRKPNSGAAILGYFGVLKLNLGAAEYSHAFIDSRGRIWDPGSRKCH
jgi:hypothetical protein